MKKLLAILLAGIMVLSFAACSKDKKSEDTTEQTTTAQTTTVPATPEEKIVGDWKATMDFTDGFYSTEGIKEVKDKVKTDFKCAFDLVFSFGKDGTLKITVDKDSLKKLSTDLTRYIEKVMLETLRQADKKYAEMSEEQLKKEFKKVQGKEFDAYVKETVDSFDDSFAKEDLTGKYTIDKDKIFFSQSESNEPDKKSYMSYKFLDDNKAEVSEFVVNGKGADDFFKTPFTMEKK